MRGSVKKNWELNESRGPTSEGAGAGHTASRSKGRLKKTRPLKRNQTPPSTVSSAATFLLLGRRRRRRRRHGAASRPASGKSKKTTTDNNLSQIRQTCKQIRGHGAHQVYGIIFLSYVTSLMNHFQPVNGKRWMHLCSEHRAADDLHTMVSQRLPNSNQAEATATGRMDLHTICIRSHAPPSSKKVTNFPK